MSAAIRTRAAALAAKYCRVFKVPKALVAIRYTEDDDAHIYFVGALPELPTWSLKSTSNAGPADV